MIATKILGFDFSCDLWGDRRVNKRKIDCWKGLIGNIMTHRGSIVEEGKIFVLNDFSSRVVVIVWLVFSNFLGKFLGYDLL